MASHVVKEAADPGGFKIKNTPLIGPILESAVGDLKYGKALQGLA